MENSARSRGPGRESPLAEEVVGVERPDVSALMSEFRNWLRIERGLAVESVRSYDIQARKLLLELPDPVSLSLAELDAATVINFVIKQARGATSTESTKVLVTGLRSLLRFLHIRGLISRPLVGAVPGVAGWRLSGLPRALPQDQVEALVAAPDAQTKVGMRDHALLLTLARLGLRGAEAASLQIDQVGWRTGEVIVVGKASRSERLPLPRDVGEAMAAYAVHARPRCDCKALFVTVRAPYRPLSAAAVRQIMARACRRASLPRLGAHRLRHTVATNALRAGASLAEVGQLLRHRSQLSTAIYAKVDDNRLGELARRWPGSEQ